MTEYRVDIRRKRFESPPTVALEGVRFALRAGEFIAIVGPSGAGKSTLLNILSGLDEDYDGEIDGFDGGGRLAFVFQSPRLMPWLTVMDNLRLVLPDDEALLDGARASLVKLGLEGFEDAFPGRLSGGMQRRVALARAFCVKPTLLLMDEPFASLDEPLAWRLRAQLHELWRRHRPTVVFVTHDLTEALSLADRVVFLSPRPGRVVLDQPVALPHPRPCGDAAVANLREALLEGHPELLSGRTTDPTSEEHEASLAQGLATP